jgi:hypothetical protein
VADVAKSVGHARVDEHEGQAQSRDSPATDEGSPHEFLSNNHFPANLEVECDGADKTWSGQSVDSVSRGLHILHTTTIQPPKRSNAPVKAHDTSVYMSLGVMALWHCSGLTPRGMIKAI